MCLSLQACGVIGSGPANTVAVETMSRDGSEIDGATCTLTNDKGSWSVETPGSVSVHRSQQQLMVLCTKPAFRPTVIAIQAASRETEVENMVLGGVTGAFSIETGVAYQYPPRIAVLMSSGSRR